MLPPACNTANTQTTILPFFLPSCPQPAQHPSSIQHMHTSRMCETAATTLECTSGSIPNGAVYVLRMSRKQLCALQCKIAGLRNSFPFFSVSSRPRPRRRPLSRCLFMHQLHFSFLCHLLLGKVHLLLHLLGPLFIVFICLHSLFSSSASSMPLQMPPSISRCKPLLPLCAASLLPHPPSMPAP